jgi:cytochrome c5
MVLAATHDTSIHVKFADCNDCAVLLRLERWSQGRKNRMAVSREQARKEHTAAAGHEQFSETIYGVVCSACHNYILIDHTNDPRSCREHETCRQAYS